jgi:hypothetical protein
MPELLLFISHRSGDSPLAKSLIELFEKALKLPARGIRCTSVDGYRLPVGADTDEQLRRKVFESRAFIGLITPTSLSSAYVLFELGARWGAKKHLAPVLAHGVDAASLGGPLGGINALRIDERNQVVQLVEDVAEYLEINLEPAASYQSAIDAIVKEASSKKPPQMNVASTEPAVGEPELEEIETNLLDEIARQPGWPTEYALRMKLSREKTNYYLERLRRLGLIEGPGMYGNFYQVTQSGREYLVKRNRL